MNSTDRRAAQYMRKLKSSIRDKRGKHVRARPHHRAPQNKVVVRLGGGLGNQMFQYAAARAAALRVRSELVLDTHSGFSRDRVYERSFELEEFPIVGRSASRVERLPFLLSDASRKVRVASDPGLRRRPWGTMVLDENKSFEEDIQVAASKGSIWMQGYWQAPAYFVDQQEIIRFELMPPKPILPFFERLGEAMGSRPSLAVGIRLYEESAAPTTHMSDGQFKSASDIERAVTRMAKTLDDPTIFVFCTHKASLLSAIKWPSEPVFVIADQGYAGSVNSLWLLTQAQHHLFTNSSYYWWGAWLSGANYASGSQHIVASNNFYNRDTIINSWGKF